MALAPATIATGASPPCGHSFDLLIQVSATAGATVSSTARATSAGLGNNRSLLTKDLVGKADHDELQEIRCEWPAGDVDVATPARIIPSLSLTKHDI